MRLIFRIKYYFFNAFREFFVHHHGSLEFRAKVFALLIAADENPRVDYYIIVKMIASELYKGDEDRANLLMTTTKELVNKVNSDKELNLDILVENISKILKIAPRYAKKININDLRSFLTISYDEDTISYQENIIEFLEKIKNETLSTKEEQIKEDEEKLKP